MYSITSLQFRFALFWWGLWTSILSLFLDVIKIPINLTVVKMLLFSCNTSAGVTYFCLRLWMFSVIFNGVCLIKHPLVVCRNLSNYVNSVFMLMKGWISFSFLWINSYRSFLSSCWFYAGCYLNRTFKSCYEKWKCFRDRLGHKS